MFSQEEITKWYNQYWNIYNSLGEEVRSLIKKLLDDKIDYHTIVHRVKELKSVINKFKDKNYNEFTQLTDFTGIRIITYTLSEIEEVCEIIEKEFKKIEKKSFIDELEDTGKVGYLSIHYICQFRHDRIKLAEYSRYANMKFEIQVRTILQHAWAEIEHDRYKFSGILPDSIGRRFDLIAGTLELLDNELNTISKLLEDYSKNVSDRANKKDLHIPINTVSLEAYLKEKLKDIPEIHENFGRQEDRSADLIKELPRFNIEYIDQIDSLIKEKHIQELKDLVKKDYVNYLAFLRYILMINYTDKYFSEGLTKHVMFITKSAVQFVTKFGINEDIIKKYLTITKDEL